MKKSKWALLTITVISTILSGSAFAMGQAPAAGYWWCRATSTCAQIGGHLAPFCQGDSEAWYPSRREASERAIEDCRRHSNFYGTCSIDFCEKS